MSTSSTRAVRMFSLLNGVTLLGVLWQAVSAGEFLGSAEPSTWITVHEISGFVVVLLALATALAALTLRRADPALTLGAMGLLVLIVLQTGLGEAITKAGASGLTVAHVPIAVLIFGLGVYLSSMGARLRRRTA
jgi:heme A synthase